MPLLIDIDSPDEHTVRLFVMWRYGAWGECACGARFEGERTAAGAQLAWANHVTDMVKQVATQQGVSFEGERINFPLKEAAVLPSTTNPEVSAPVGAIQDGITRLEEVYETLHQFVNGESEPPIWDALMFKFRSALDRQKAGCSSLIEGGST